MITLSKQDILIELARRDLTYFVNYLHQGYAFAKFNKEIMQYLNVFLSDIQAGKRPILIIQAPPQHGKSELASRNFPAFAFGKNPNFRIAGCSYNSDLAASMNRDVQRIMLDERYSQIFPLTKLNSKADGIDSQALRNSDRFDIVQHRGYYVSCGIGGSLTGKSVDIGIIDDPIKNMQEARSPTTQETLLSWYKTVFLTRLSKDSGQLIMATRWSVNDLIGYIIDTNRNNKRVTVLKYPALTDNQPLLPSLHPLEQLEEQRQAMDSASWSALYQQEPVIEGGNLIKLDWFGRYSDPPSRYDDLYIVCDTALTAKKSSDYSAFLLCGIKDGILYILDGYNKQVTFPSLHKDLLAFYARAQANYPYNTINGVYIENKGSGISLIQQLSEENRLPIMELTPTIIDETKKKVIADKYTRFLEIEATLVNGRCILPQIRHSWLEEAEAEFLAFTGGNQDVHDDYVDCLIYAIKIMQNHTQIDYDKLQEIFR